MQQAVSHLPDIPHDHCFHIAQIWCLLLGDCKYRVNHNLVENEG